MTAGGTAPTGAREPVDETALVAPGRPACELSDPELEQQGTQAHFTRNWVFLHGTAEQFARHTSRMLELEQEYLRRYPKRTWQGSGGASGHTGPGTDDDPVRQLLALVAAQPDGRMHKLEVHQAARTVGLPRAELAVLYTANPAALITDQQYRVITEHGRSLLRTGADA